MPSKGRAAAFAGFDVRGGETAYGKQSVEQGQYQARVLGPAFTAAGDCFADAWDDHRIGDRVGYVDMAFVTAIDRQRRVTAVEPFAGQELGRVDDPALGACIRRALLGATVGARDPDARVFYLSFRLWFHF